MFIDVVRVLTAKLWADDCGAVLTAEYLTLGSVVVLGGVSGLTAMSRSMNNEMAEFGNSVRAMRQTYAVKGMQTGAASVAGSAAVDSGSAPACVGGHCDVTN